MLMFSVVLQYTVIPSSGEKSMLVIVLKRENLGNITNVLFLIIFERLKSMMYKWRIVYFYILSTMLDIGIVLV